jgi:hypothetical protein
MASPAEGLAIAAGHVRTVAPVPEAKTAYSLRYLDLSHLPGAEQTANPLFVGPPSDETPPSREEFWWAISFFLNSVSKHSKIEPPIRIADGKVVVVDLYHYGIDPAVWDRLAEADPYYHSKVTDLKTNKVSHTAEATLYKRHQKDFDDLYKLTYSFAPILRGDWFLFYAGIQADRKVGYYDFLGIGNNLKDFQALAAFDAKAVQDKALKQVGAVKKSSVTHQNRIIVREGAPTGGLWRTVDFKSSVNRQNAIRLLEGDTEPPQGDATEQYLVLPNKLFAYGLFDQKGARQDSAPDFIAGDGKAPDTDKRVHIFISCVRCHVEGLRPVNCYFRRNYKLPNDPAAGRVEFATPSKKKEAEFRDQYATDIVDSLAVDTLVFAKAIKQCNGLTIERNARVVSKCWDWYAYKDVSAFQAGAELGCEPEAFMKALYNHYAPKKKGEKSYIDNVIAGFLAVPADTMRREQYEEVVYLLYQVTGATHP